MKINALNLVLPLLVAVGVICVSWWPAQAQVSTWVQQNAAGKAQSESKDLPGAEKCWLSALQTARTMGANDPRVAETMSELGDLYARMERYEESASMSRAAIRIKQSIYGRNNPELFADLKNYSRAEKLLGQTGAAEATDLHLEKILLLNKGNGQTAQSETAAIGDDLRPSEKSSPESAVRTALGSNHVKDAENCAYNSLLERNRCGSSSPQTVALIGDVVHAYLKNNDASAAKEFADRALAQVQQMRGFKHTEVAYVLSLRAEALRAAGNNSAAADDTLRAQKIYQDIAAIDDRRDESASGWHSRRRYNSTLISSALPKHDFFAGQAERDQQDMINWQNRIAMETALAQANICQTEDHEMRALESRQRDAEAHTRRMRGLSLIR